MKRKLQDDQWADDLKAWENAPSSEAWDRPSAAMWGRIAEDLPPKNSKKHIGWWLGSFFIILLVGMGGLLYSSSKINPTVKARQAQLPTVNSSENLASNTSHQLNSQNNIAVNNQYQLPTVHSSEDVEPSTHHQVSNISIKANNPPRVSMMGASKIPVSTTHKLASTAEEQEQETDPGNVVYSSQAVEKSALSAKENIVLDNQFTADTKALHPLKEREDQPANTGPDANKTIVNYAEYNLSKNLDNKQHSPTTDQLLAPIPNLHFMVQMPERSLTTNMLLSKPVRNLWSADIYGQRAMGAQQFRSPHIQKKKAQTYSYGVQLNRKLPKGFSLHAGLQETRNTTNGISRFVRIYNHHNEILVGIRRVSEFNLTTELGEGNRIDDNVKIERNEGEAVEDQTRLVFQVERQFSLKTYSIPLQLGYALWSQYPFQLTGLMGAKFSRTEQVIENVSVTVNNPKFNIRQVRAGSPMHTQKSGNTTLLAGLRLAVQLSPKLSAITQIDYQVERRRQRSPFTTPDSSLLRLGLSYKL